MTQKVVDGVVRFGKLMNIFPPLENVVRVSVPDFDLALINVDYLMDNWADCSRAVDAHSGVVYGYAKGRGPTAEVYLERWFFNKISKAKNIYGL
ncbi:hypothetical protein [Ralstonia phage phiRSL1]|uniref:Uncharacterized protein n=1 Tax=Ralstonia phage phiRSL1 TaxID=1980924 RepID=B2ZY34_9CAUD|nr:hypothetical protein RSL1_ORF163 [Ralstonia phage phiRSL1]BAG41610.1 hypothetical protein [Ralstonia phage phiRSL1]